MSAQQVGEQRRLEAVAGPDLQDALGAFKREGFDHPRHERGLGRHLTVGDRQRPVQVGPFDEVGRDESRPRHLAQGTEHARIEHALGSDLPDEVLLALHGTIMHASGYSRKCLGRLALLCLLVISSENVDLLPRWDCYTMGCALDGRERFACSDAQGCVFISVGVASA
jgi:hypothetical protein